MAFIAGFPGPRAPEDAGRGFRRPLAALARELRDVLADVADPHQDRDQRDQAADGDERPREDQADQGDRDPDRREHRDDGRTGEMDLLDRAVAVLVIAHAPQYQRR